MFFDCLLPSFSPELFLDVFDFATWSTVGTVFDPMFAFSFSSPSPAGRSSTGPWASAGNSRIIEGNVSFRRKPLVIKNINGVINWKKF